MVMDNLRTTNHGAMEALIAPGTKLPAKPSRLTLEPPAAEMRGQTL